MHSVLCEIHLSSDEEHLGCRQPFIVCHQHHLGNDLFWPVATATVICMEMMLVLMEDREAADDGGVKHGVWRRRVRDGKKTHVLLIFRVACVIIKRLQLQCVDELVCQQGTLWQHMEHWAVMMLYDFLNRGKYKRAHGNVVFLFQAILLPSIYISESLAHQRGIYSPSVLLSQSGGKCNLAPLCLHVSGGQCNAGWNAWEKHCSKWGCSADIKPSLLLYSASLQFCWGCR